VSVLYLCEGEVRARSELSIYPDVLLTLNPPCWSLWALCFCSRTCPAISTTFSCYTRPKHTPKPHTKPSTTPSVTVRRSLSFPRLSSHT